MKKEEIQELINQMTLEEKASLCSGADFWHTKKIERLNIPASMVSDGPHGLRKQNDKIEHAGTNESIKAVCFPTGCALAASFNRELLTDIGAVIGNECQAEGVSVILGPAANIKRSPLCGRNFEYYSEDPLVASEMAGSFIEGVQSKNVGTSLKHFLANNQEHRRMSVSSNIDERALREIYLAAFEGAVKKAKPWTVMCSYNCVNGIHTSEDKTYLSDILRDEWGFDGYVVSDWGAVNNRVNGLKAGLDLEMPSSFGINDAEIVNAVRKGILDEAVVNRSVERILNIIYKFEDNRNPDAAWSLKEDHNKAVAAAEDTIVLLKNNNVLPLNKDQRVAFIGEFAEKPRYQGGGSSHINSQYIDSALSFTKGNTNISYSQGYHTNEDEIDEKLLEEAVLTAQQADIAVIFAGLPDKFESEGFDREHMKMPKCQNVLIDRITEVQKRVIVVLHNGSPIEMPWIDKVQGLVEVYLGGEGIGAATVKVLYGDVNPSGRLPETFPIKLEDNPSYLSFPGETDNVDYKEGIFVGYRYYDKKKMNVLFPFGFGLSYTTFAYSNLKLSRDKIKDSESVDVTVDVTNIGTVAGKEVVQLYISDCESTVIRPDRELRDFAKIELMPGEKKTVSFTLSKRSFAYFNTQIHDWHVESGMFTVSIGKSSRDMVLNADIYVESTTTLPVSYTLDTICGDLMQDEAVWAIVEPYINLEVLQTDEDESSAATEAITKEMNEAVLRYMPLRGVLSFGNGTVTLQDLEMLLVQLNHLKR